MDQLPPTIGEDNDSPLVVSKGNGVIWTTPI